MMEDLGCGCGQPGPTGCDNQCGSTTEDLGCGCGEPGPSVDFGCETTCSPPSEWAGVKDSTCGTCAALVFLPSTGTCADYCASIGHTCVEAFEEVSDTCQTEKSFSCDERVVGSDGRDTGDAICTCSNAHQAESSTEGVDKAKARELAVGSSE